MDSLQSLPRFLSPVGELGLWPGVLKVCHTGKGNTEDDVETSIYFWFGLQVKIERA